MLKKIILASAAIAATFTALPASAEAHGRKHRGYYSDVYYGGGYHRNYRRPYRPRVYSYGYAPRAYGYGYYPQAYYPSGYSYGYAPRARYYRDDRYYGRRCGSGTTGAIIGGAAGALLGREVGRSGRRGYYGYRRGGSGTTGAIIGGAAGALIGREIGRSC